jgi:MFS family permease
MRRLLVVVGLIILVDTMLYAAITPLLPEYAERFDLTKTGAGVLSGSYAAGALIGTVPSAWLAMHAGSRRTMLIGLSLMSLASLGFAFGETIAVLDATRFLQGIGGACSWAGGMGWLISITPPEQRGATIGSAMSAAVAGFLLGPVIGAVARATGPELPFTAIAALGGLLALAALRLGHPPAASATRQPLSLGLGDRRIRAGAWLVTMPALVFGAIEVLAPLELDRLGATGLAIGATFLGAAALEGVAQVLAGRATDRWGRGRPIRISLLGTLAFLLLVPLPDVAWLLAVVVGVGTVLSGVLNTPAMTLLSDGVEAVGLDQGFGFAIVNFVWAGGQVGGAIAGGALAAATSDATVYLTLAVLCAATLTGVVRAGRRAAVAAPAA